MQFYYTFYLILVFSLIASYLIHTKNMRTYLLLIVMFFLVVFAGLAYKVGGDFAVYEFWFNSLDWPTSLISAPSPLWILLNKTFFFLISDNYWYFHFFIVLLSMSIIYRAILRLLSIEEAILFLILFGFTYYFNMELWYIRAGLSSAILFYAVTTQRDFEKYLLFVVAFFIHYFVAIPIVLIIVYRMAASKSKIILISILIILVSNFSVHFLATLVPKINFYLNNFGGSEKSIVQIVHKLLLIFLFFYLYNYLNGRLSTDAKTMVLLSAVVPFVFFFNNEIASRFRMFFVLAELLLLAIFFSRIKRGIAMFMILFYLALLYYNTWNSSIHRELFLPYKTFVYQL